MRAQGKVRHPTASTYKHGEGRIRDERGSYVQREGEGGAEEPQIGKSGAMRSMRERTKEFDGARRGGGRMEGMRGRGRGGRVGWVGSVEGTGGKWEGRERQER